jgi:3',5'-nucleoside bisphosphate phosphatase
MDRENTPFIDLHIHTLFSDGMFSPEEAVSYAKKTGLSAISITDHDNIEGILPALKEGEKLGVEVVPGVELSTEYEEDNESNEVHILGYLIDWEDAVFQAKLQFFRKTRQERAYRILQKLENIGIKLSKEKIFNNAGKGSIGRLHFARVLLEEGHVGNIPEAFNRFLSTGKPAYEPKFKITPQDAIRMILDIKGLPVLAHPYYGTYNNRVLMEKLKDSGLCGIEVWHRSHPKNAAEEFLKLAQEFDLIATGGSDCHGSINNEKPLMGTQKLPYEILKNLKERRQKLFG